MTIGIVGVGLIGGSMAITLREKGFADKILGSGRTEKSLDKALALGLIDEKKDLKDLINESDLIILSIPVDALKEMLPHVLDSINDKQVVIDVGSTKEGFLQVIKGHPKRNRFVATHPMAGTEYSGPEAAVKDLFKGKSTVFCDIEE
ncbi:MAG: prephenate dehydrogenase/arogenate dehydrogenase family protein, partial [Chitinophagaceae bacterium]